MECPGTMGCSGVEGELSNSPAVVPAKCPNTPQSFVPARLRNRQPEPLFVPEKNYRVGHDGLFGGGGRAPKVA